MRHNVNENNESCKKNVSAVPRIKKGANGISLFIVSVFEGNTNARFRNKRSRAMRVRLTAAPIQKPKIIAPKIINSMMY